VKPHIVNANTPKAGFLGMLAAWIARVPVRIYTLHGLRLETVHGLKRLILWCVEWVTCACAHRVVCVSHSLQERAVRLRLTQLPKTCVLARGTPNGVRAEHFDLAPEVMAKVCELRAQLSITSETPVIGFVGRLVRDKGIEDLLNAFECVLQTLPDARLVLVGDFEPESPLPVKVVQRLKSHPRIVLAGFVHTTEVYYHLFDVMVLPSYREGFPIVILEANAAGIPVVGYAATGTVDAIVDGVTGTLVPVGDITALAAAIKAYLKDPDLRRRHGQAARERVLRDFRQEVVWEALYQEYVRLLKAKSLPTPQAALERENDSS